MKKLSLILLFAVLVITQDPINTIKEVVITPKFMAFKTSQDDITWTIQTLNRNFDLYRVKFIGLPDSSRDDDGDVTIRFFSSSYIKVAFSRWTSGLEPDTLLLEDVDMYGLERDLKIRDKLAMIAFLNRKKYSFIENFFRKTFTVGSKAISTSLDNPIDIIDFKNNEYLFYQDRNFVYAIYKNVDEKIAKSDYEWVYKNKQFTIYPKADFVKRKPILSIKENERSWYNTRWEKMRQAKRLFAIINQDGLEWNSSNLNKEEENLVLWFKKN